MFSEEEYLLSPEFQSRFTYRDAPRDKKTVEELHLRQLGHMVEHLTDAMIIIRRISDDPHIDVSKDPAYEPASEKTPSYVDAFIQDPRHAPSYHHSDLDRERLKKRTHLTLLADALHGMLRRQGNIVGNMLVLPEKLQPMIDQYDGLVARYQQLVASHGEDYHKIPTAELELYEREYKEISGELFSKLRALPSVTVKAADHIYELPNDISLNPRMPDSCPATVLFALRSVGKEMIDRNKRSSSEFRTLLEMVGVESLITDTIQSLFDLAKQTKGAELAMGGINYPLIKKTLIERARDVQLTLAFTRIADIASPVMHDDLALFARMGDSKAELGDIKNPDEAAFLLYAVERGLARKDQSAELSLRLQALAEQIAKCGNLDVMRARFESGNAPALLEETRLLTKKLDMQEAALYLESLEKQLSGLQHNAGRMNAREESQRAVG